MGIAQQAQQKSATYAASEDFCRIFAQDMDHLYLLSLLLTGDEAMAERCFADALRDSAQSPRVFREWAHSWARRMVVQTAIQMLRPRAAERSAPRHTHDFVERPEIAAVLALPDFDRFVFVMSVLERDTDHDCALLLGCSRSDVVAARIRALQQIGSAAEAYRQSGHSEPQSQQDIIALAATVESIPHFATLP
jgi:hypothetical protein